MLAAVTQPNDPSKLFADAAKLRARAAKLERQGTRLLRDARVKAGYSQEQVAAAMSVTQERVSHIENATRVTPEVANSYIAAVTEGGQDGQDNRSRGAREDLRKARGRN